MLLVAVACLRQCRVCQFKEKHASFEVEISHGSKRCVLGEGWSVQKLVMVQTGMHWWRQKEEPGNKKVLTHRLNRFVILLFKFKNLKLVILQVAMALVCFSNTLGFHLMAQLNPFVVFL